MRERLSSVIRLALSSMVTSVALTLAVTAPAHASTVYSYTGNDFTDLDGFPFSPYTTSDFVTVTMTTNTPLAANQTVISLIQSGTGVVNPNLLSLSMSDGVQTLDLTNTVVTQDVAAVATGPSGNIVGWVIELTIPGPISSTIETQCCGALQTSDTGVIGDLFGANGNTTGHPGDPGTWSITSPTPAVPLPAALPLFASGLGALGLLGWRRKKKAAA